MATAKQLKSILKSSTYPATNTPSKADRDRETALYHANLIQQRKDIELEILLSTETLIDYPLSKTPYNASNPSSADAASFKSYLRHFQPSDYDALIVERNINEHCGYALCPNLRLKEKGGGTYRLLGKSGKAKDFRIVEKSELEKWCSEACARRALYVRVQLSETPAWERGATGSKVQIDLLDEPKSEEDVVVEKLQALHVNSVEVEDNKQDSANLALERGDKGFVAHNGLVEIMIKEKEVRGTVEAPCFDEPDLTGRLDTMHLTLEGHTPTFGSRRHRRHEEDLEEEEDGMNQGWI